MEQAKTNYEAALRSLDYGVCVSEQGIIYADGLPRVTFKKNNDANDRNK